MKEDLFNTQNRKAVSKRDKSKMKIEKLVLGLLEEGSEYCGDDTHIVTRTLFARQFGFNISVEQIIFIGSVARSRRKTLNKHPELDMRTGVGDALEVKDREYYRE